ncbi:hypothetical protein DVH05_003056 [Phytophthora capsici]|nr:hypothetical protein DVH05_003056 [Phytophthora capsici]
MGKAAAASKVHLTNDDYRIIVRWMEYKEHFDWIHGTSDKTTVSGKPNVTKSAAFNALAEHLFTTSTNPKNTVLNAATMRSQWTRYKKKKVSTFKAKTSETGMGLTPQ